MIRIRASFLALAALVAAGSCLTARGQDPDTTPDSGSLDIEYAEQVPLATHSLMLALAKSGNRLVAAGERGHIILSDDQGQTWRQAEAVPTRSTLTSLFAVEGRLWAAGHDSVILTSGDGGDTWTRQYFDAERQQPIMDLYFHDGSNGIAIGAYGLMLLTSDGGNTWEDWAVNDEDDAHLNTIMALTGGAILIGGEAGNSYRSRDEGETWERLELPYEGSLFGAVLDAGSCAVLFGLRGHVMRSCDEGDTWEELETGSEATLLGAATQDGETLFAGNSGAILIYSSPGRFVIREHSSGVDFASVLALGSGNYLLAGEDGLYFYPETGDLGEKP